MNNICILIVDDDFAKIASIIKTIKETYTETLSISQASNVQEAIENLSKKEFHVLIADFFLPLRANDEPVRHGGITLIKSLYRSRTKVNVPMYVVGLTQYEALKDDYNGVWKVWHYDASSTTWKDHVRDLIHHVSLVKSRVITEKIETIFVEGYTDKLILESTLNYYFCEKIAQISIDTIGHGGGASWVERQLIIWAKSLTRKEQSYLKAVGVVDDDEAGLKAITGINKVIQSNSAEDKTFGIVKNSYKYSPVLKSLRKKGISFPTTVEDLFTSELLLHASKQNWLEERNKKNIVIDRNILDIRMLDSTALKSKGFTDDEILITLNSVKDEFKMELAKLACTSKENLVNISYVFSDILNKLHLVPNA